MKKQLAFLTSAVLAVCAFPFMNVSAREYTETELELFSKLESGEINADVNNDGKLDVKEGAAIEHEYNEISKSKTVYDITQDGDIINCFAF